MPLNLLSRGDDRFVAIDSIFPQKEPLAFRNAEINEYLRTIRNFSSYTMPAMLPDRDASFSEGYGMSRKEFRSNKAGYLKYYPQNGRQIHYLNRYRRYNFGLAYSFFLGETYTLLPFYESNRIPFTFVLYPGGRFAFDQEGSDRMLKRIFSSRCFKGVIVTQKITRDYLMTKKLCPEAKIKYIYGGFVQFNKQDVKAKKKYKINKKTFDICFVAAKYTPKGVDKGYDLFIETAKQLCRDTDDVMFHVVGGFDESDIDITEIKKRIKFYGYQRPDFLKGFYSRMDIFLGPNRPFMISPGSFDGFPLGIDASYCGVAMFVADELKMNTKYIPDTEIVIVALDSTKIATEILSYYCDLGRLYALSENGQKKTQELFDIDRQIKERVQFFGNFIKLEMKG